MVARFVAASGLTFRRSPQVRPGLLLLHASVLGVTLFGSSPTTPKRGASTWAAGVLGLTCSRCWKAVTATLRDTVFAGRRRCERQSASTSPRPRLTERRRSPRSSPIKDAGAACGVGSFAWHHRSSVPVPRSARLVLRSPRRVRWFVVDGKGSCSIHFLIHLIII